MEIVLKSDNKESLEKIIALAKKLNVIIEIKEGSNHISKDALKERILRFNSQAPSSFGDAAEWERDQRTDRDLTAS